MRLNGRMRQVAGGDHVRWHHPAGAARPQAFGQMHFDEAAVPAAQLRERVERLHYPRPLRPTASDAARQRDHGHGTGCQRVHACLAIVRGKGTCGIQEVVRGGVFDAAARWKAVLRQPDAAAAQIGLDLLVLRAVEPVRFQKPFEALRAVGFFLLAARSRWSNKCSTMPENSATERQAAVNRSSSARRTGESRRCSVRSSGGTARV